MPSPHWGFVFDLDGTLLDDIDLAKNIPLIAAKRMGYGQNEPMPKNEQDEILNILGEKGPKFLILRVMLKVAAKLGVPWYRRLKFLAVCQQVYLAEIASCPLFPGVFELLEGIRAQGGKIGVLTTSSSREIDERFKGRQEFLDLFDGDIIGRDHIRRMKPNPEGILHFSEKWGIPPSRMFMIGDMTIDIQAGLRASCIPVGVLTGFATQAQLEEAGAKYVISDVTKLRGLIAELERGGRD